MAIIAHNSPVVLLSGSTSQVQITIPPPPARALVAIPISIYGPNGAKGFEASDQFGNEYHLVIQDNGLVGATNWRQGILYVFNAPSTPQDWVISIRTAVGAQVSVGAVAQVFTGVRFNVNPLVVRSTGAFVSNAQSLTVTASGPPLSAGSLALAVVGAEKYADFAIQNPSGWTALASSNTWDYPNSHPFRAAWMLTGTTPPVAVFNFTNAAVSAAATALLATGLMLVFDPAPASGPQPTASTPAIAITTNDVSASGSFTAAGAATVALRLFNASGSQIGPVASPTIAGTSYSHQFQNLGAGTYTVQTTVTDANGSASATSASFEIVGLSSSAIIDPTYLVTVLAATPLAASVRVAVSARLCLLDQNLLGVSGATAVSGTPGVATVSGATDANGYVTITGVAAGTSTITLSHINDAGTTLTTTVVVTVAAGAPQVPGVAVVSGGASSINVTITDNNAGAASHVIQVADSAEGPWSEVITLAPGTLVRTVSGLRSATDHFVRVRAVAAGVSSLYSAPVSATTGAGVDSVAPSIIGFTSNRLSLSGPGSVVLSAEATDNVRVDFLRFYRDGVQIGSNVSYPFPPAPVSLPVTFTGSMPTDDYLFEVEAVDTSANVSTRASLTVAYSHISSISIDALSGAVTNGFTDVVVRDQNGSVITSGVTLTTNEPGATVSGMRITHGSVAGNYTVNAGVAGVAFAGRAYTTAVAALRIVKPIAGVINSASTITVLDAANLPVTGFTMATTEIGANVVGAVISHAGVGGTFLLTVTRGPDVAVAEYTVSSTSIPPTPKITETSYGPSPVTVKGIGIPGARIDLIFSQPGAADVIVNNVCIVNSAGFWSAVVAMDVGVYSILARQSTQ